MTGAGVASAVAALGLVATGALWPAGPAPAAAPPTSAATAASQIADRADRYGSWSTPADVSTPTGSTPSAAGPATGALVGTDATGNATVLFSRGALSDRIVQATRWSGSGWTAADAGITGEGGYRQSEPDLAVNASGQAMATWVSDQGIGATMLRASWYVPGTGWRAMDVEVGSEAKTGPRVAVNDAGQAIIVWQQRKQDEWVPMSRRWNGTAWGPITRIPTEDWPSEMAVGLAPDGTATAVWTSYPGYEVFAARSSDGVTWSVNRIGGGTSTEPAVAVDSANAVVVWTQTGSNSTAWVGLARYSNGTWSQLTSPSSGSDLGIQGPQVAYDTRGTAVIAWAAKDANGWSVQVRTAKGTTRIASAGDRPTVGVDAQGRAVIAWQAYAGSTSSVQAAAYDGSTWTAPTTLSNPGVEAERPSLAVAASGVATAAWAQRSGDTWVVAAARLTPAPPTPSPTPTPTASPTPSPSPSATRFTATLSLGASRAPVRSRVSLAVAVKPGQAAAGARIRIQVNYSGSWSALATRTLDASGRYRGVLVGPSRPSVMSFRVVVPSVGSIRGTTSPARVIRWY